MVREIKKNDKIYVVASLDVRLLVQNHDVTIHSCVHDNYIQFFSSLIVFYRTKSPKE